MIKISRLNIVSVGKIKAFVDLLVDDTIAINGLAISDSVNGPFIQWPSVKTKTGEYKDIAHPVTAQGKEKLTKFILDSYDKKLKNEDSMVLE